MSSTTIKLFETDFYKEQTFEKVKLDNPNVSQLEFYKCTFNSCNFSKTLFENCVFEKCIFNGCDFSVAKFKETAFIDVKFTDCKMLGIDWTLAQKPNGISFQKCVLNDSSFYKLDLRSSQITGCTAHNVDFENVNLSKSDCSKTDFLNAKFNEADLSSADFTEAVNYAINPNNTKIKKAKFSLPEAVRLLDAWDIVVE